MRNILILLTLFTRLTAQDLKFNPLIPDNFDYVGATVNVDSNVYDTMYINSSSGQIIFDRSGRIEGASTLIYDVSSGKFGVGTSMTPQHLISILTDNSTLRGGNTFNITHSTTNKVRTSPTQARDTSSIYAVFTQYTAKPRFGIVYTDGSFSFRVDSNKNIYHGFGSIYTPRNTKNVGADSITDAGGITAAMLATNIYFNQGQSRDISANPQIADGTDGQLIRIIGLSDARTLKLDDGTGLQLSGGTSFTLGSGDVICFLYVATLDLWIEVSRSDN